MSDTDQTAANERGRQANEFNGVLLAMAGHDLRQPLQSIMSSYEWLSRRLHTSSEQEYLRRGMLAIMRLNEQLDRLIEAIRLHEHSANVQLVPIVLAPILARLFGDNEELADRKGITLRVRHSRIAVVSNPVLLEGILRNIISNALKYTGPGGRVLVGCRRRGAVLKIEVHDTGIGIPPDKLAKVFEAFHQLDSTQTDGLGLGLFVVRRAVDLLGHGIEVRSTVGRGSCFSVLAKTSDAAGEGKPGELFGSEIERRHEDMFSTKMIRLPHVISNTSESWCAAKL